MDVAADHDPLWANLVNRGTSLSLALLALAVLRRASRAGGGPSSGAGGIGVLEMTANVSSAYAATEGLLSLTRHLGARPVVVVFLSWLLLHERLERGARRASQLRSSGVALIAGG